MPEHTPPASSHPAATTPPVTIARVHDEVLPSGRVVAVVTMDDGAGPGRPPTLSPAALSSLAAAFADVTARAHRGEIHAVALTGKPGHFAAGADLRAARAITDVPGARALGRAGHAVVAAIADLPVPTLAWIDGAALGGGLELALACDYRLAARTAGPLGLPEVSLGLVPGWGGTWALPRLLGPERALELIVDAPLRGKRPLEPAAALAVGLLDAVVEGPDLRRAALVWTEGLLEAAVEVRRPSAADASGWDYEAAAAAAQRRVDERLHGAVPAPYEAIALLAAAGQRSRDEAFAAEDEALARLLLSQEFRAALYAWELTTHRARHPERAPDPAGARTVRAVGVAGAGLMAGQLALLLARRLDVPVVMRDLDEARAQAGLAAVHAEIARLLTAGRLTKEAADRVRSLVSATDALTDLAASDLVIEAVVEDLGVKRRVLAQIEDVVGEGTVLATNTSALSVAAMGAGLRRPERLVGLHFFNPVSQMPLVEVISTPDTDEASLATAFAVAHAVGKAAIAVADAPGFVVNRLLVRLLGEVLGALEEGTSVAVADRALRPMGLPMGPFQLLQLVGPAVAGHVLETLRSGLGERFPASPGLARLVRENRPLVLFEDRPGWSSPLDPAIAPYFGSRDASPLDEAGLLARVQDALAEEAHLMLAAGVVRVAEDLDLAMILGAGWPNHLGGITPYLDRVGAAERVTGRRFHAPGVADLPADA